MGMFDYLHIHDPEIQLQVKCAHGHTTTSEVAFQTKDLDCGMDALHIVDNHLHRVPGDWLTEPAGEEPQFPGDLLEYTGQVRFYAGCPQCPKTFWVRDLEDVKPWGPQKSRPWNEYIALFVKGKLVHLEAVQVETIEEDIKKMKQVGWIQTDSDGNPLTSL